MNRIANFKPFSRPIPAKIFFVMVALALIASLGVAQVRAKANTVTTTVRRQLNMTLFVPCAARGAGENVYISGPLNIVFVTTVDDQGHFQTRYEIQPKGISGLGESTGVTYRGTGVTEGTFNGKVENTKGFENFFRMSAQPGGTFQVYATFHVTVSARGVVTATIDQFSVKCKSPSYPSYP